LTAVKKHHFTLRFVRQVYPGNSRYSLAEEVEVLPLVELAGLMER